MYDDDHEQPEGPATIGKTLETLREDGSMVKQNLALLRDWIAKHPHIRRCRTDARFLLRFLRAKKHSFLAASQTLERYLAARRLHPSWFQRLDIRDPELADLADIGFLYALKERDADGCLMALCDWGLLDPKRYTVDHSNRMHALWLEAYGEDVLAQCAGAVVIFDMQHVQLAHHSVVSLSVLRQVAHYVNNAVPIRCKALHAVNVPAGALWIVNGMLGFLNEKIRNRCSVSGICFVMVKVFRGFRLQTSIRLFLFSCPAITMSWQKRSIGACCRRSTEAKNQRRNTCVRSASGVSATAIGCSRWTRWRSTLTIMNHTHGTPCWTTLKVEQSVASASWSSTESSSVCKFSITS